MLLSFQFLSFSTGTKEAGHSSVLLSDELVQAEFEFVYFTLSEKFFPSDLAPLVSGHASEHTA
jgi:hypothetical protein